jgi:NADPH:quinone reductase-like Zn-dependent oxidoreductase
LPGLEVAGRVAAGDAGELARAGLKLGDAVCGLTTGGGYAELCVIPLGQCLPVPAGLSMVDAAAIIGPRLAAVAKESSGGDYTQAFLAAAALSALGIVLSLVLKRRA